MMITIKSDKKELDLSILDLTCKKMVIDSSWVYYENLDEKRIQKAVEEIAEIYPELTGSLIDDKILYPQNGILFEHKTVKKSIKFYDGGYNLPKRYQARFNKKRYLFSIKLTSFPDGSILSIKGSHALVDGYAFYRIYSDLMSIYRGGKVPSPLSFDNRLNSLSLPNSFDSSFFFPLTDEDKKTFFQSFLKRKKRRVLHIEKDMIEALQKETGCSSLTAILAHLYVLNAKRKLAFVITANHRAFVKEIGMDYGKNASSTIYPIELREELSLKEAAYEISKSLRERLKGDECYFSNYLKMIEKKDLSSLPFSLSRAYGKERDLLIINSFLSFDLYFDGAEYALPPSLKDPVRLFPLKDGSLDIILIC